jgi:acyl-CoA dehydrogenase
VFSCRTLHVAVMPYVDQWDEEGTYPDGICQKAYAAGIYGIWPAEYGGNGPEDADVFHHLILNDELCRCGSGGFSAAVFTPQAIALPPILEHGSEEMKQRVAPGVVRGEKHISLALTG